VGPGFLVFVQAKHVLEAMKVFCKNPNLGILAATCNNCRSQAVGMMNTFIFFISYIVVTELKKCSLFHTI
jgi:exosome complex RNA-binding protein Csl4